MDATEHVYQRKAEIVERYGKWTAHNLQLPGDVYTIDKEGPFDGRNLRRVLQIVSDIACAPLKDLQVLDLACLEGGYAIELARHGARVLGIEGREMNIQKAMFAGEVMGLENLEFVQDDVRNISDAKYGQFDVVLCLGILYHIDVPDVFRFVEKLHEVSRRIVVIDTHISVANRKSVVYKGKTYCGSSYTEFSAETSDEKKATSAWSSLDNIESFWFTRTSLYNLLADTGFTSVFECHNPSDVKNYQDRVTLLAIKGTPGMLLSTPPVNSWPADPWPENDARLLHADRMKAPQGLAKWLARFRG